MRSLVSFKAGKQEDVYKYDSLDELKEILELLDRPLIENTLSSCYVGNQYKPDLSWLNKTYGLVFYWSHHYSYDDYPTEYCSIIDGASVSE